MSAETQAQMLKLVTLFSLRQIHCPLLGKWKKDVRPLKWQKPSSVLSQTGKDLMYDFLPFRPWSIVSRQ